MKYRVHLALTVNTDDEKTHYEFLKVLQLLMASRAQGDGLPFSPPIIVEKLEVDRIEPKEFS